jgi:hypothetical protein
MAVITASPKNFSALLESQKAAEGHLSQIKDLLISQEKGSESSMREFAEMNHTLKNIKESMIGLQIAFFTLAELNLSRISNAIEESVGVFKNIYQVTEDKLSNIENNLSESLEKTQAALRNTSSVSDSAAPASPSIMSEEEKNEAKVVDDEKIRLLSKIEENTRGGGLSATDEREDTLKKKKPKDGGSLLDNIFGFLKGGILDAFKIIFSPKAILGKIIRFLGPAVLIGGITNGIIKGFKEFQKSGDLKEAVIEGLGGLLEFLSFGLFDANTLRNLGKNLEGLVEKYVFEPIFKTMTFLEESFNTYIKTPFFNMIERVKKLYVEYVETPIVNLITDLKEKFDTYIKQPIVAAFDKVSKLFDEYIKAPLDTALGSIKDGLNLVGSLITQYIIDPVKEYFSPIATFFKDMKDKVFGFMENFTIPEIGFTIPGTDTKVSLGPWYPFRKEQSTPLAPGEARTATSQPASPEEAPPSIEGEELLLSMIARQPAPSTYRDQVVSEEMDALLRSGSRGQRSDVGPAVYKDQVVSEEMDALLRSGSRGNRNDAVIVPYKDQLVSEEMDALLRSGSRGNRNDAAVLALPTPALAAVVAQESANVSAMKESKAEVAMSPIIAPAVTNNVSQTQVAKITAPVRIQDSTVDRYFMSRAAF